jgi:hypothetical protein
MTVSRTAINSAMSSARIPGGPETVDGAGIDGSSQKEGGHGYVGRSSGQSLGPDIPVVREYGQPNSHPGLATEESRAPAQHGRTRDSYLGRRVPLTAQPGQCLLSITRVASVIRKHSSLRRAAPGPVTPGKHTLRTAVGRPQLPVRSKRVTSEIDYRAIVEPLLTTGQGSEVLTGALSDAWSAAYRSDTPTANLYAFGPEPWTFLFDFSSATGAPQWDSTVAAWGLSAPGARPRDESYQRRFHRRTGGRASPG